LDFTRNGDPSISPLPKGHFVDDTPSVEASKDETAHSFGSAGTASQKTAFKKDTAPPAGTPIIAVSDVNYTLDVASRPLHILRNVSFRVEPAEVVAIVGPSGSGKTSLLMLLAGLERTTSGRVAVAGQDLSGRSEDELALFRRNNLGIVFQSFHLIPSLTALDNVGLALEIAAPELSLAQAREAAAAALTAVGLGDRLDHRPAALSGGEQQRVGLARAMIAKPRLLLADEPTGNLDQKTGALVIELMFDLARRQGTAVVLITHDPALAARADRVLTMTQGELVEAAAAEA
jgi:putative ABC transport system ATP-binding protein